MKLQFFNAPFMDKQMELVPRVSNESTLVLILLVACIVIISFARLRQREVFQILVQNTLFFRSQEDQTKDGLRPSGLSRMLLALQFALVSSGAIYWYFFIRTPLTHWQQLFIPLFIPTLYMLYLVILAQIAGNLFGKAQLSSELSYLTIGLHQLLGVVVLLEFFVSYFQPNSAVSIQWLLIFTYLFFLFFRFLRGFFTASSQGVAWYYIILYFWTLEILPVLIVAKLLFNEEFRTWIG